MTCKDCKWYGKELVDLAQRVYEPLIEDYSTIKYKDRVVVCNYTQPSSLLEGRLDPCNNFEEIVDK